MRVGHWGWDWSPEDADTHRSSGGIAPGREDAVAIVADEPVAVRSSEDLPEQLHGPRGGRVRGDVDVHEAAAPDFKRNKDGEDSACRGHRDTEVACHEGLGVIPHESRPPLPGRAAASPITPAAHVSVDGAWRHAHPELHQELRGTPHLAPGRIVLGHGGNQPLHLHRQPGPAGPRPPTPEESEGVAMPPQERGGLHDRERLPPGKAARQQDQREPYRIRRPSRPRLPLAV